MGWNRRRFHRFGDPAYREFLLKQEKSQERGTRYRRSTNHQKKTPSESEIQKREWKRRKSQYRDRMRNWTSYKCNVKHYCAKYYRAWLRSAIKREDWDSFYSDRLEYRRQENPWSWD